MFNFWFHRTVLYLAFIFRKFSFAEYVYVRELMVRVYRMEGVKFESKDRKYSYTFEDCVELLIDGKSTGLVFGKTFDRYGYNKEYYYDMEHRAYHCCDTSSKILFVLCKCKIDFLYKKKLENDNKRKALQKKEYDKQQDDRKLELLSALKQNHGKR